MPLIYDGIKYKSKDKSKGYDLIDDHTDTGISFKPTPRGKKTTPQPNYSTVMENVSLKHSQQGQLGVRDKKSS